MAPLKIDEVHRVVRRRPLYPWLKGRGSFVRDLIAAGFQRGLDVSMAERLWLL